MNALILLFQCYLKPILYHSRHISHCKIDFVNIWLKESWFRAKVKTTLERKWCSWCRSVLSKTSGMWTLTGGAIGGCPKVLDRWRMALIILVESGWTDGLDCEMKGLNSMIGITGCDDIESEVRLVGQLRSGGWGCRSRGRGVRNWTHLFQRGVVLERLETTPAGGTVVEWIELDINQCEGQE